MAVRATWDVLTTVSFQAYVFGAQDTDYRDLVDTVRSIVLLATLHA